MIKLKLYKIKLLILLLLEFLMNSTSFSGRKSRILRLFWSCSQRFILRRKLLNRCRLRLLCFRKLNSFRLLLLRKKSLRGESFIKLVVKLSFSKKWSFKSSPVDNPLLWQSWISSLQKRLKIFLKILKILKTMQIPLPQQPNQTQLWQKNQTSAQSTQHTWLHSQARLCSWWTNWP